MAGLPILLLLAATGLARADNPAADTLQQQVEWIEKGTNGMKNNFFHGEIIVGKPKSELEEVAGCLMDKVGAIVEEGGVASFANDLQVDLAACCTKDKAACQADVKDAYALLTKAKATKDSKSAGQIAALILRAAEKRVDKTRVKASHSKYFGLCSGSASACTLDQLKIKTKEEAGDDAAEQEDEEEDDSTEEDKENTSFLQVGDEEEDDSTDEDDSEGCYYVKVDGDEEEELSAEEGASLLEVGDEEETEDDAEEQDDEEEEDSTEEDEENASLLEVGDEEEAEEDAEEQDDEEEENDEAEDDEE